MNANPLPKYDEDYYGWAVRTVSLVRDRKMDEIDFDGIVEELDDMVSSIESELINRLVLVISHLLKWQFQPTMRGHSWIYTIREQRVRAKIHLEKNPGLKGRIAGIQNDAYRIAVSRAAKETTLDDKDFPANCPYTFEQIMDEGFYPPADYE